jgi:hypothetical protein
MECMRKHGYGPMNPTLQRLIDLLTPVMGTPAERTAQFRMAYGLRSPVVDGIDVTGDPRTFLANAADKLHAGGHLITLLESVREGVGPDVQAQFDALIAEIAALPPNAFAAPTPASALPPRVFISYARSDGEPFAAALRAALTRAGIPLWQDRVGMEGGRDWWL